MKKTFNINVAGFPFTIDDDAYTLLNDYLDTIEHAFRNVDDSNELISDIETRIAELLLECSSARSPIITTSQVEDVIRRIGKPEEMLEEGQTIIIDTDAEGNETMTETDTRQETVTPPPFTPPLPKVTKKLYRDPQNAMIGGVCSGIANYLNYDVTWVRIVTVLLTFISVATCGIAYLILWIVIPEAQTPIERMQMLGERPTMENIGKTVTESFKEEQGIRDFSSRPTTSAAGVFGKILIICGLIIGIPILISLTIGLLGCLFSLVMFCTSIFTGDLPFWARNEQESKIVLWGIICGIGCLLFIGIPLFLLIRKGIAPKAKNFSTTTKWTLSIICALAFLGAAISVGMIIRENDRVDRKNMTEKVVLSPEEKAERAIDNYERALQEVENATAKVEDATLKLEEFDLALVNNNDKKTLKARENAMSRLEAARRQLSKAQQKAEKARRKMEIATRDIDNVVETFSFYDNAPADSLSSVAKVSTDTISPNLDI